MIYGILAQIVISRMMSELAAHAPGLSAVPVPMFFSVYN